MVEGSNQDNLEYSVEGIIKYYADYKLPVLTDQATLTERLNDPHCATGDLTDLLRLDPIFALYAQRLASKKQQGRLSEIHGLEHALSMIGVNGVKELTKRVHYAPSNATDWRQICAESVFAESIARELAELKTGNKKIIASSALFTRASEWLMYWLHPRRSWQMRRMHGRRPFHQNRVADALFGFRYADLQIKIIETHGLPDLNYRIANFTLGKTSRVLLTAIKKFRRGQLLLEEESRHLRLQLGAVEMAPIIANRLAEASCSPWLKNGWGRWIDIAAIYCHKSKADIYKAFFIALRKMDRLGLEFPLRAPYSSLLSTGDEAPYSNFLVKRAAFGKDRTGMTNKKTSSRADPALSIQNAPDVQYSSSDRAYIMGFYNRLTGANKVASKMAISQTLKLLLKHSPIERCSFLLVNAKMTAAKSIITLCSNSALEAFSLLVPFRQTPTWGKFAKNQAFLLFSKEKHEKVWSSMPPPLITAGVECFMLNSVAYNGQVRALMYADFGGSEVVLPRDFIHDFKHLCAGLAASLRNG